MGAVGVAAMGVVAVFYLANTVAAGTGRSLLKQAEEPGGRGKVDLARAAEVAEHQAKQH